MIEMPLPANPEAEAALTGSVLIDASQLANLAFVQPEFFTVPICALAWRAIRHLQTMGQPIDQIAIEDCMDALESDLARAGAAQFSQLINAVPTSLHAEHYGLIVLQMAQRRKIIREAERMAGCAYDLMDPHQLGEQILQRITRILSETPNRQSGRRVYGDVLTQLQETTLARMDNAEMAIQTGFPAIDTINGGFEPGQFVLIAGRPGSGKSALGLSIGRRIAGHFHHKGAGTVEVVTLEMTSEAQARRLIASRSNIDSRAIRQGFRLPEGIDQHSFDNFMRELERDREDVGDALAFHEGSYTSEQIAVIAAEAQAQHGMRVLIVDQLDLMADTSKDGETDRISKLSLAFKRLAMRLGIVVICLTQLNRNTEARGSGEKRPQLADLRQSGRLEMDADIVYAVYRPSLYFKPDDMDPPAYAEWAELLTLKYRDGQAGLLTPLRFQFHAGSFTDWGDRYPVKDMAQLVAKKEGRMR